VESVCKIPLLQDVSITTNGVLLKGLAQPLFDAGLRRINVSLDTLNREKYAQIAGLPSFQAVWDGLQEAEAVGFTPIKINVVAIRGFNDDEFGQLARLSMEKPYHIRFIEYMPIGTSHDWGPEKFISTDEIKARIERVGPLQRIPRAIHDGPAQRYQFKSARGEVGFISPLSHHFCPSCNRLRLTADGKLRPCLFSDDELDIRTALREGAGKETLKSIFRETIARKPREHHAGLQGREGSRRSMISIGG